MKSIYPSRGQKKSYIKWLHDPRVCSIYLVGGKALNLQVLAVKRFPIPPGFCVTTDAYKFFVKEFDLDRKIAQCVETVNLNNLDQLKMSLGMITGVIENSEMPALIAKDIIQAYHALENLCGKDTTVAIRSSATEEDLPMASFAGQMATHLNVRGDKNILEAIQKCWAALFTERAVIYREKHGFKHTDASMGVLIQKMVDADKSGVMFTIKPVTKDHNKIVIEANFGLGESVVSSAVTTDTFIVDKQTLEILQVDIGSKEIMVVRNPEGGTITVDTPKEKRNKACLATTEIQKLAEFGRRIEEHYSSPQDVEWAISGGDIYILQTRPVTAL